MRASPSHATPYVLSGAVLLALTVFKALGLTRGSAVDHLAAAVCLLILTGLSILLLLHEGYGQKQVLTLLLPIGLALFLRLLLLDHATLDYQDFLSQWVSHFRQYGGFSALKDPVGNYNAPYLYLLAFLSYLPFPDLYGIKLFSILFDILLAWGGLRLVKRLTDREAPPLVCFFVLLLLPTVVLNGACWGQCDSVWAALCLHALSFALDNKPNTSLALLALAFSFKLQAIFIIPLWLALWFSGRVRLRNFPIFPAAFILTMVPALLAGKPVRDILSVYLEQASDSVGWQTVNYNSPSVFSLVPYGAELGENAPKLGIALAFLFMAVILLLLFRKRHALDSAALLLAGATLSLGIPFFLPYMHERYFFLGGVLLVIWACASPFQIPAAVGAELASLGGYHAYLMKRYVMPLTFFGTTWAQPAEGLLMLSAVVVTAYTLWKRLDHI